MVGVKYKAQTLDGNKISGVYTGDNFYFLVRMLRSEGYFVTAAQRTNQFNTVSINHVNKNDLAIFSSQFSEVLSSGINMDKALSILINISINKSIKKSLFQIKAYIECGMKLESALSKFPNIYPKFMVSMIEIGEDSGNLDVILKKIAEFYNKEWKISQQIKNAMIYPTLVVFFTFISLFIIVNNVLPKVVDVILSLGGTIPKSSVMMLKLNSFVINYGIIIPAIFLAAFYKKVKKVNILKLLITKLPYIRKIYLDISISKICSGLSILLGSGVNIIDSLNLISNMAENERTKNQIVKCIEEINKGNSFLDSIKGSDFDVPIVSSMISLGESAGKLDDSLLKASNIVDENNARRIKKILSLLEPFLIIILTFVVGIMIINVVVPMLNVMDSIK